MKDVLGALDRGETVVVLHRGKERAMLTPVSSDKSVSEKRAKTVDQPLFGLWNDREDVSDPGSYVQKLREFRINHPGKTPVLPHA
jgi:hypothetical protein